jgi:hypothetical protein
MKLFFSWSQAFIASEIDNEIAGMIVFEVPGSTSPVY